MEGIGTMDKAWTTRQRRATQSLQRGHRQPEGCCRIVPDIATPDGHEGVAGDLAAGVTSDQSEGVAVVRPEGVAVDRPESVAGDQSDGALRQPPGSAVGIHFYEVEALRQ